MHVYLIDPVAKTVTQEQIADGETGVARLIGYDSLDSDEIDINGDRLYFDESCFIRHGADMPRFKVDSLAPVAGRGVVCNSGHDAPAIDLETLRTRVTFL